MMLSIVPAMRAARLIGIAERKDARGDFESVLNACRDALELLEPEKVDLELPWCRSAASLALWGYARAALKLDRKDLIFEILNRWRPQYLQWATTPADHAEAQYLSWFEDVVAHGKKQPSFPAEST